LKEHQKITQEDMDHLVEIADNDPKFKKTLRELDQLANARGLNLNEVIETACALYLVKQKAKEWNNARRKTI